MRAFNILVKDTMKLEHVIAKQKGKLALHLSKMGYCYAKNLVYIYLVVNYMYAMQCQMDSIK